MRMFGMRIGLMRMSMMVVMVVAVIVAVIVAVVMTVMMMVVNIESTCTATEAITQRTIFNITTGG
jgi:hypothetical protein